MLVDYCKILVSAVDVSSPFRVAYVGFSSTSPFLGISVSFPPLSRGV